MLFRSYTKRSFGALAATVGLRINDARYFFHWMAAAKLATRLVEALVPGAPTSPMLPPALANDALYLLSRLEERLLGRLSVPFGTSLLIVGGNGDGAGL